MPPQFEKDIQTSVSPKKYRYLIGVVGIILIGLLVMGYFWWTQNQAENCISVIVYARNPKTGEVKTTSPCTVPKGWETSYKPFSTTSPNNDFSDWKTYSDEQHGFEFRYPENLNPREYMDGYGFERADTFYKYTSYSVSVFNRKPGQSLEEIAKIEPNLKGFEAYPIKERLLVAGKDALMFSSITGPKVSESFFSPSSIAVYIENDTNVIFLSLNLEMEGIPSAMQEEEIQKQVRYFNHLLSTFKFTSTSTNAVKSGIKGTVTIGPTCPVMREPPNPKCADKPYKTKLRIGKEDTDIVIFTESDINGNFSIDLDPGTYYITVPDLSQQIPSLPDTRVVVPNNEYVAINLQFDSGIR